MVLDEPRSKDKKKKKRGKKGRHADSDDNSAARPIVKVGDGEMPEGAVSSEDEVQDKKVKSVSRDKVIAALDQNLDM